jgi:hypothetical protein
MWNALTTMVGYLNQEGYCANNKCHVSAPLSGSPLQWPSIQQPTCSPITLLF